MSRWKLWFVLLLLLPFCTDNKDVQDFLEKTISKEPDATQICTNNTLNPIVLIVCKIHTERSRGEECQLLYRHRQDFESKCDSRFTLMKENQTFFLHLNSLTAEDSGNYTCECTYTGGTYRLHLNVNVKEEVDKVSTNSSTEKLFFFAVIGVPAFIIISAVSLGLFYIKTCHSRRHQVVITSLETTSLYTQAEQTEPSNDVIMKENVIYGL